MKYRIYTRVLILVICNVLSFSVYGLIWNKFVLNIFPLMASVLGHAFEFCVHLGNEVVFLILKMTAYVDSLLQTHASLVLSVGGPRFGVYHSWAGTVSQCQGVKELGSQPGLLSYQVAWRLLHFSLLLGFCGFWLFCFELRAWVCFRWPPLTLTVCGSFVAGFSLCSPLKSSVFHFGFLSAGSWQLNPLAMTSLTRVLQNCRPPCCYGMADGQLASVP